MAKPFIPQMLLLRSRLNMPTLWEPNSPSMVQFPNAELDLKPWNLWILLCITITNSGWFIILCILSKLKLSTTSEMSLNWASKKWENYSQKSSNTLQHNKKLETFHHKTWLRTQPLLDLPPNSHGDLDTAHLLFTLTTLFHQSSLPWPSSVSEHYVNERLWSLTVLVVRAINLYLI